MAIYGKYFEYNGKSSKDMGFLIGGFENLSDEIPMGLSRAIDKGETNNYRYRANHFGTTYNDVLEFELSIIKDPCIFGNDLKFSRSDIRELNAWLTSPKTPRLFHMTDYDDDVLADEYVDYFCIITNAKAIGAGDVDSLTYTLTCDSPFGYSESKTAFIQISDSSNPLYYLDVENDELEDYVYPTLKITPFSDGEITIANTTDNGSITINAIADLVIYIDSQKLSMYDETKKLITFDDLGINDVDDIYWFRLCNGENEIKLIGDCTVEISYREIRKVGAY